MDFKLVLLNRMKRKKEKNFKTEKDTYHEREINFILKDKIIITLIKNIQQLKAELNKMIFPYYELIQGIKRVIINLDNEQKIIHFFIKTDCSLIYENVDKKVFLSYDEFNNYHINKTKFEYKEISPNYGKYFSEKNIGDFYMNKFTQISEFTKYFDLYIGDLDISLPLKLYGPYKSGKTTALLYFHGIGKTIDNTFNNSGYFRSSLYLNLKYYFESNDTEEEKKKIFENELCCLFYKYEWYKSFIIEIIHLGYFNFNFSNDGIFFTKVYSMLDLFVKDYKVKETNIELKDTIVIFDEYTYDYDQNKNIDIFKNLFVKKKKFVALIQTQLRASEDINDFIEDFYQAPSITNETELIKSIFYLKIYTDIPEVAINNTKFIQNFGNNYYYYKKFQDSGQSIDNFIEEEKSKLIALIDSNNKCLIEDFKLFLTGLFIKLDKIKLDDKIKNLLKILPLNFLYLERCENNEGNFIYENNNETNNEANYETNYKTNNEYIKIVPHLPIITQIIKENSKNDFILFSKNIDFKKLNPILYGIIFDRIVHFKINDVDNKIFGKRRKSVNINPIFDGKTIFNFTLKEYSKQFSKVKIDNKVEIISFNQEFSGQNYDEGLLIINKKKIYLLIIQTKTGNSYNMNIDEVLSIPFELLYISKKIEAIFGIKIDDVFFSFITDYDNAYIEELCKKKGFNILFYNIKDSYFYNKINSKYLKINNIENLLGCLKKIILPKVIDNKYIYSTQLFSFKLIPNLQKIKKYLGLKKSNKITLKGVLKFHDYFKTVNLNSNEFFVIRITKEKYKSYFIYSKGNIALIDEEKKINENNLKKIMSESSSYIILFCCYY